MHLKRSMPICSRRSEDSSNGDPKQDWVAVVIYPNRAMEQDNLKPYRCLIDSEQLVRIYQDELPSAQPDQFELGVLELIAAKPQAALEKLKRWCRAVLASKRPAQMRKTVIKFIETVILHQFPHWT